MIHPCDLALNKPYNPVDLTVQARRFRGFEESLPLTANPAKTEFFATPSSGNTPQRHALSLLLRALPPTHVKRSPKFAPQLGNQASSQFRVVPPDLTIVPPDFASRSGFHAHE